MNRQLSTGPDRPLRLRMRRDLEVHRHRYQGREYWVLKDPLSQKYYRFEEEEYWLLGELDGEISLHTLRSRFEKRFAPQRISLRELHHLMAMLHRSALVLADVDGQGPELLARNRQRLRRERRQAMTNLLCVRFKGFDPDRLLEALSPYVGWIFTIPCFAAVAVFVCTALLLLTAEFETFQSKLPEFHEFFAVGNWLWLAGCLAVTKVIHEFGHGLSCKRFGGECHEMGAMLLVLTPCLYCNVTDSWTIPNKWKRATVGAAGMYVELMMAATATYLWWFSNPGLVNYLSLNIMFVCSVSTLLFNANPLMRYDGYYILSDLLEIPNLRQKANTILRRRLGRWLLGLAEPSDPFLPHRHQFLFAVYAVLAAIYRWVVVGGILWFVYHVFEPYGVKVLGQVIACFAIYGLVLQPVLQLIRFFQTPGRYEQVNRLRFAVTLAGVAVALAAVFLAPLPHYVRCDVYVQQSDSEAAYVETEGTLAEIHVRPGDRVLAGQAVITIHNIDIQLAVAQLYSQQQQLSSRLTAMRQRAFAEDSAIAEIAEIDEALEGVSQQLQNRRQQQQRLQVVATRSGSVLPIEEVSEEAAESELRAWSGSPLDRRNLNAFLPAGQLICRIGDPRQLEAILAIDQSDIEFVEAGQVVQIVLAAFPSTRQVTQLDAIAQVDMETSPTSLSAKGGGDLATRTDPRGYERPLSATYQGSAHLDDLAGQLFNGATGRARIRVGHQTIAQRAWRLVCQTFSFDV